MFAGYTGSVGNVGRDCLIGATVEPSNQMITAWDKFNAFALADVSGIKVILPIMSHPGSISPIAVWMSHSSRGQSEVEISPIMNVLLYNV